MSRSTKPDGSVAAAACAAGRTVSVVATTASTVSCVTTRSTFAMDAPQSCDHRTTDVIRSWLLSHLSGNAFHSNVTRNEPKAAP